VKPGYELEFEDTFEGGELDSSRWLRHYLPHWSSRERTAARYTVGGGALRLRIDEDTEPWCPEFDGDVRASVLQTGQFSGPLGSPVGQLPFTDGLVVRSEEEDARLYTPHHGYFEIRSRALDDPTNMVALWMMGYNDEPERSGEILIMEIFGRDVGPDHALVGMGVRPFTDPALEDGFAAERLPIDAREFHVYAAEWKSGQVSFFVDDEHVKTLHQAPAYPLQLMLAIYEFRGPGGGPYPKEFVVDYVRGYRPVAE
jgi:Glycosyl hydrolases family 16